MSIVDPGQRVRAYPPLHAPSFNFSRHRLHISLDVRYETHRRLGWYHSRVASWPPSDNSRRDAVGYGLPYNLVVTSDE